MNNESTPFPTSDFEFLAKTEDKHWWFRARNQLIIWVLKTKTRPLNNYLEVGCGTGFVIKGIASAFPKMLLEGTEYHEEGLIYARNRLPSCVFRQSDARLLCETSKYECIGSFDVLEHIDDDELVISNFYRAIRSGGYLLLTVPQHPWLWSSMDDHAHHQRRYKRSKLIELVTSAGFTIDYCSSFVSFLFPLMFLSRILSRNRPYSPNKELQISRVINFILYLIMQTELRLMKLGLRLPIGGSIILLARK